MKNKCVITALLLLVAGTGILFVSSCSKDAVEEVKVEEIKDNGAKTNDTKDEGGSSAENVDGQVNGHEYVDLGLPSGTLWATCNVGAEKPEEYGDYFAWGETSGYNSGKTEFTWAPYKYWDATKRLTKYCPLAGWGLEDHKKELESEDDAATSNWGSGWQTPSATQFDELRYSLGLSRIKTTLNGTYGVMIKNNTSGKHIFLPAAGSISDTSIKLAGSTGYYWSRSLDSTPNQARAIEFGSRDIIGWTPFRYSGLTVRPVRVP